MTQEQRRLADTRNPAEKLTAEQVQAIRLRYAAGETQAHLCRIYAVSLNTIGRVIRRETWNWLKDGEGVPQPQQRPATAAEAAAAQISTKKLLELLKGDKPDEPAAATSTPDASVDPQRLADYGHGSSSGKP